MSTKAIPILPGWAAFLLIFAATMNASTDKTGTVGIIPLDWHGQLVVRVNTTQVELRFGTVPAATAGYDAGLDTLSPPKPPSGFYATFVIDAFPYYLACDWRASADSLSKWILLVTADPRDTIRIEWSVEGLEVQSDSNLVLPGLELEWQGHTIDMLGTTNLAVSGGTTLIVIRYFAPEAIKWRDVRKSDSMGIPVLLGRRIRLGGVVTVSEEFGRLGPAFLQDRAIGSFGLAVLDSTFIARVRRGDSVVVEGTIKQDKGLAYLSDVALKQVYPSTNHINPLPLELKALADSVGERLEGLLVSVADLTVAGDTAAILIGGTCVPIEDSTGVEGDLFVFEGSKLSNSSVGPRFSVQGVVVQVDSLEKDGFWQSYAIAPLEIIEPSGVRQSNSGLSVLPENFSLQKAFPNPFNGAVTIPILLHASSRVHVDLFSVSGALVRRFDLGFLSSGLKSVRWDGTDEEGIPQPSGVYVCRVQTQWGKRSTKLILLR